MSPGRNVRPATGEELHQLYEALARLSDPADIAALLEDICTIREREEMSQRLEVARLLAGNVSYTAITERTGASATTIARVAKALNHGAGGYQAVLGGCHDADGRYAVDGRHDSGGCHDSY